MPAQNSKKIRLGICMAGAVSAGAYTAGVIDYLIETLEHWQQIKNEIKNKIQRNELLTPAEELIPMHDVIIEVLSGASAGGMTAAVLAYSFNDGTYFNKRNGEVIRSNYNLPVETDRSSKLYNAWINMVDDGEGSTFQKLMHTDDVAPLNKMKSILNSNAIDQIAEKAIPEKINFQPPEYVSDHVSIILSVTNLEGVPIDVRFSNIEENDPTCNVLKMHSGFLHYQFRAQPISIDFPAEIISEETKAHLADAAKATGAFPFGLANRKIIVNKVFFDDFKSRLKNNYKIDVNLKLADNQNYVFNAVDGGAINNEPIGTTVRILDCKKKEFHPSDENYLILIDPFPTVTNAAKREEYCEPKEYTLLEQAKKLIGAIRNQSMFKQEDLLNGLEMDKRRFLIYPTKRKFYFLACGLIEGFSGFFKKEFRKHDYQLGRKNCQAFLRFYFGETPGRFNEVTNSELNDKQFEKWRYNVNYGKENKPEFWKIPLIPDMLLLENKNEIETPKYNGLTTSELDNAGNLIKARIEGIIDKTYPYIQHTGKNINKIFGWILRHFPGFFKRKIALYINNKVTNYLFKTFNPQMLKQHDLLLFFLQQIETKGQLYQKTNGVWARISEGGEKIISKTSDGEETCNIASTGDFIVKNDTTSKEEYIIKPGKFHQRYVHSKGDYYIPNEEARVYAIKISRENIIDFKLEGLQYLLDNPGKEIYIEAPWSESQKLCLNDYLVIPLAKDEVYRIAEKEFLETYVLVR